MTIGQRITYGRYRLGLWLLTQATILRERADNLEREGLSVLNEDAVNGQAKTVPDEGRRDARSHQDLPSRPPLLPSAAETILWYVCTPDRLEAVLGDLQRNFARRAAKQGEKAAHRWFWWQTIRTVAAFGVQVGLKAVIVPELLEKLRR